MSWVNGVSDVSIASQLMITNAIENCDTAPTAGKRRAPNSAEPQAARKKKPKIRKDADNYVNAQWNQRIPTLEIEARTWEGFIATEDGKAAIETFITDIIKETGESTDVITRDRYHCKLKRRYQYYHGKYAGSENDDPNAGADQEGED